MFTATRFRLGGIALLILVWACAAAPALAADVTITNPEVTEGDTGTSNASFTVTLTRTPGETDVTLDYQTVPGLPADPGDDFIPQTGQITFLVGETTKTITVPVVGDTVDEPAEPFYVELTGPGLADTVTGTATIVDDDPAVLSIGDVVVTEGTGGTANAVFTVTASSTDGGITVNYATADGTATAPFDYTATNGTLTFADGGELTQTITVPVLSEFIVEPDETFVVNLSNPSANASLADPQGQATIRNDDVEFPDTGFDTGTGTGTGDEDGNPSVQARVLRGLTLVPSKKRVSMSSLLRLKGLLRVSGGPASCRSRQKIAIQRRKSSGGRFQTFEVAVTGRSGSFKTSTRPVRTYQYRARVSQTTRCMGATSKAAKVVVRKLSKGGSARR